MGTRADFYVGRGAQAEWLGSTAYDGYPDSFEEIGASATEKKYRERVAEMLAEDESATLPAGCRHASAYSYHGDWRRCPDCGEIWR